MSELKRLEEFVWEVPKQGEMRVPGRIYADQRLVEILLEEEKSDWSSLRQLKNVATLPGIQKHVLTLPDVHPGYGSPIGGVAAFDLEEGVITFGAVGFDINCGVRTLKTGLTEDDLGKKKELLADELFKAVPAGLGSTGDLRLSESEIDEVLVQGAEYAVKRGYGFKKDLEFIEENGRIEGADPHAVSHEAKKRQFKQVGTLGSGNHYLEVQVVEEIFDEKIAKAYGLSLGQLLVSIHCGSRALGHQIGTDYLKELAAASRKYKLPLKDRELVSAPIQSPEGQKYFAAVKAGINTAFANRQAIAHLARQGFNKALGVDPKKIETLYEVGHNTAKVERHEIDGKMKEVLVQRKGSTRGFGPGRAEVPEAYRSVGQPILVGGTMGTHSYILAGTEKAMKETFGSSVHGAGRLMSRTQATRQFRAEKLVADLKAKGMIIKGHGFKGIAEEAPGAYKDVTEVVDVVDRAGVGRKVVKVRPIITVKG